MLFRSAAARSAANRGKADRASSASVSATINRGTGSGESKGVVAGVGAPPEGSSYSDGVCAADIGRAVSGGVIPGAGPLCSADAAMEGSASEGAGVVGGTAPS